MKPNLIPAILFCAMAVAGQVSGAMYPQDDPATPVEEADRPSGNEDLEGRILPWSYFRALAAEDDVLVIDVREEFLEGGVPSGLETARPIPLKIFLQNFVARRADQDKTLLIFDQAGRDLAELARALDRYGYEDYFFLAGGAEGAPTLHQPGS